MERLTVKIIALNMKCQVFLWNFNRFYAIPYFLSYFLLCDTAV